MAEDAVIFVSKRFQRAAFAFLCLMAAQLALAAHDWSPGPPVRVRMGLHTGDGTLGGDDYVGIDVHRAARIAGAAHGGQILLSDSIRALAEHALPEGASLRDLGQHRLKDIAFPERLHELVIEGLPSDFPAPRTLDARPNNLPVQLTSFVGREQEIAEVRRLLDGTRLLTLSGPGGSGKSRLALEVAAELLPDFRDGAFFADLSSVADPALVPSVVARAVGVPQVMGRPALEAVKQHLRDKQLLLVADNFEQVAEAAPMLEELLSAAPALKVMVTSRVVLSLRGEQEYLVPSLDMPNPGRLPDVHALGRFEAVRLFVERAQAVRPGFRLTVAPGESKTVSFPASEGLTVSPSFADPAHAMSIAAAPLEAKDDSLGSIPWEQPEGCDEGTGGGLPVTGAAAGGIAAGAAVLLAAGAVLFVMARRRRIRFPA